MKKTLIISLTAGGTEEDYAPGNGELFTLEEYMPPFKAFANLCGMTYAPEILSTGFHFITPDTTDAEIEVLKNQAQDHADRLVKALSK